MTDLETMRGMLDRAGIPYEVGEDDGLTVLRVGDWEGLPPQPHQGGYVGFFSELAFTESGALHAIWAWE